MVGTAVGTSLQRHLNFSSASDFPERSRLRSPRRRLWQFRRKCDLDQYRTASKVLPNLPKSQIIDGLQPFRGQQQRPKLFINGERERRASVCYDGR